MIYFGNTLHACMTKHFVAKVTKLSLFSLTFEAKSEDIKQKLCKLCKLQYFTVHEQVIVCKHRLLKIVKNCLSKLRNSDKNNKGTI